MGLFMRVSLCRHAAKAKAHVKYIAFRSREGPLEERGAFDRNSDHADVGRFNDNLEDHLTRHPMANKAYKVTLSLSEREFGQRGMTSWKTVVREAMENLQKQWGMEFQWIAAEHMAKGHPHVHIVIKAVGQDESGRFRQLRLDKQRLEELRREVDRVIERRRPREQERLLSRADTFLRDMEAALRSLSRHDQDEDREWEHQLWLRGRSRSRDDGRGR